MKLSSILFTVHLNGYQFTFRRDDTKKVWTFDDKSATISALSIEKAIETMQGVIDIVKVLNKTKDETIIETVATLSQGDAA